MYCTGKASGWFFRHEMSDLLSMSQPVMRSEEPVISEKPTTAPSFGSVCAVPVSVGTQVLEMDGTYVSTAQTLSSLVAAMTGLKY